VGIGCWRYLPWDSAEFGFPAGRVELLLGEEKDGLRDAIEHSAQSQGICHLTARLDAGDLETIQVLERAGYELIDGILTFARPASGSDRLAPDSRVRPFQHSDLTEVLRIARTAYSLDRFHADTALTHDVADRVNESWVRNSCKGIGADVVLVASTGAAVMGYVTCRIDAETLPVLGTSFGSIVMVATAAETRRRGIAQALTMGALAWFHERGVQMVEVGTQLRNLPASRLYERCGFHLSGSALTLRKIL
jgi:dTDP-4-amino-4,6-dideoxy-D-galactose acyltransferase